MHWAIVGESGCLTSDVLAELGTTSGLHTAAAEESRVDREFKLNVRNRVGVFVLAAVAVAIGATVLAFGLLVLVGLAGTALVVGAGVALYQKLTGRLPGRFNPARRRRSGLDPSLEVFPPIDAGQRLPPRSGRGE